MNVTYRQNAKKQTCFREIEKTFKEPAGRMSLKWANKGPVPRQLYCYCCDDNDDGDDDEDDNVNGLMKRQI